MITYTNAIACQVTIFVLPSHWHIFLNEPGRRAADYIKPKKQRPAWAPQQPTTTPPPASTTAQLLLT
jgi:hypothetical protein